MIREACPVGAFVTFENGRWWEVSERTSREKVGSLFRDCLAGKYKSSAQNKIAQRKVKREANKKQRKQQQDEGNDLAVAPELVASFLTTANQQQAEANKDDNSSVSSGNASFYDVDDLCPVPLHEL